MNDKNTSFVKVRIIGTICMATVLAASSSVATQFVAERMSYHSALGTPLFGRIYNPLDWLKWSFKFYDYTPATYSYAFMIFGTGAVLAMLVAALIVGLKSRSSRKHEGIHGTAQFASPEQVDETGLLNAGEGVYCGGYDDPRTGRTQYLRHNGPEHLCVIAPTGSGKGVGVVVPTLLSWAGSAFILDRKGENHPITAGWRQKCANNVVLRFDPAEPGVSCSWNPLGEIRFGTRYQVSDAQNIALMVIDDDGKGVQGNHWRAAAYELLTGVIMHALYKSASVGRYPCLHDCANMLTGVGDFAAPERQAAFDDGDIRPLRGLFEEMRNVSLDDTDAAEREAQLTIRSAGTRFNNTSPKELTSIISTANNALSLYRDPIVGENTSRSDFKIIDLVNHEKPVSLYFVTTPRNADRMKPLMRLLLTQIVMGLSDRMEYDAGRAKTGYKHHLLLMLDEFPTLGRLEVFESALAFIRGYGIKAYIIVQDVQQLYKAYSTYENIISNCHIQIAYAPNKWETAEWLSRMTGQTTVIKEQISTSGKRFGIGAMGSVSRSYQEVQRPLMTADEVRRLPEAKKEGSNITAPGELLVFVAGHPVIRGRQILYFLDPTFSERSRIAPPKTSDVVRQS